MYSADSFRIFATDTLASTKRTQRKETRSTHYLSEMNMTEPDVTLKDAAVSVPSGVKEARVSLSEWAFAVLLTMLVGLSGAALLGATFLELLFDSTSALVRVFVLLPVLVIASYLLVRLWLTLNERRSAAKK